MLKFTGVSCTKELYIYCIAALFIALCTNGCRITAYWEICTIIIYSEICTIIIDALEKTYLSSCIFKFELDNFEKPRSGLLKEKSLACNFHL